jgi:hypothetical protein
MNQNPPDELQKRGPYSLVNEYGVEFGVEDPEHCTVQVIFPLDHELVPVMDWGEEPKKGKAYQSQQTVFWNRVIVQDIRKNRRSGYRAWELKARRGENLWCNPAILNNVDKGCGDNKAIVSFSGTAIQDWREREERVDRAMAELYTKFCKGS